MLQIVVDNNILTIMLCLVNHTWLTQLDRPQPLWMDMFYLKLFVRKCFEYITSLNQPKYTVDDQASAGAYHKSEDNTQPHQDSTLGNLTENIKLLRW